MTVRWTRPALRDLETIGDFIARDDPSAATRVVALILERADRLGVHPHIGRAGRVPQTRELVVAGTPFVVAYRVRADAAEVLAVVHGSRRWPEGFG